MKGYSINALNKGIFFISMLLTSSNLWATNVNGQVGATSVPSLSGSMLVVLSLLLFAVAFRLTRQNKTVNKFMISLLGVGIIVTAGSGIKLISEAKAGLVPLNLSDVPSFGSPGSGNPYTRYLVNNSGQPVTITFTPDGGANPSSCTLQAAAFKPVKALSQQAKLAAAPPPKCGDATATSFAPGGTYSVTIPAGGACLIQCGIINGG